MSKKISEMNYLEKYEQFKKGIIELIVMQFNGKLSMLEPIVFLGVKHDVINHMLKNKKDGVSVKAFDSGCDCEVCQANRETLQKIGSEATKDKIHIMPIMISQEMDAGVDMAKILGPQAIEIAKDLVNQKVHKAIEHLNSVSFGAVQYTASITEAYMIEQKISEQENSMINMGQKPKTVVDLENSLKDNGGVKMHPNAKEKTIIMFECNQFSEIVTFDMIRSEDSEYQELANEFSHGKTYDPATGHLTGLIHKEKNVN